MTTTDRASLLASLTTTVSADLAAWEKVEQDRDLGGTVLSGTPFIVAQADCSLALRIEGCSAIPVSAKPSACGGILGSSQMTRKDAERISRLRGDGYEVVPVREIASRRITALRSMLATLREMEVAG